MPPPSHRDPGFSSNSVACRSSRTACRRASWTRPPTSARTPEQPAFHDFGSVPFSGRPDALFERHLLSDAVVEPSGAYDRQRFEALARSVRDLLSRRWIKTQRTYDQQNPKRIYYMSMEFLIGRSLTNNVTNLMLQPFIERSRARGQPGLVRPGRAGARCRARQWRPRTAGRVLPRFDGDHAAPGDGLRAALRVRHVSSVDRDAAGSASIRTTGCAGRTRGKSRAAARRRGHARLHLRDASGQPADRRQSSLDPDRHSLRPAGGRLWRQDDQQPAAVERGGAGLFRLPGLQLGRLRRRPGRQHRGADPDPRSLPGRLHRDGAGAALCAGILPGRLLAGRPGAPLPPRQPRLEPAPRQGRHPAQRYPSHSGGAGTDAHPARRGAPRLGAIVGPHAADPGLHEPHAVARGAGKMAAALLPADAAATSRDHLRDQPSLPRRRAPPLSRRRGPRRAREPDRGRAGRQGQGPYGKPGDRRLAQHERRRRDPFRAPAHDDGARPGGDLSRALQQQDQWRHAAAMAAAGQSRAVARHHRCHRRRLDDRFRQDRRAEACRRRRRVPPLVPASQARRQGAVRQLAESDLGAGGRSRQHLRLPDQAHPRIQAPDAQRAADRRAVQPAAREPGSRHGARARSSSAARRRRPITLPSSSSSSSTTWRARSTAIPRSAGGSRSSSSRNTASRWPNG